MTWLDGGSSQDVREAAGKQLATHAQRAQEAVRALRALCNEAKQQLADDGGVSDASRHRLQQHCDAIRDDVLARLQASHDTSCGELAILAAGVQESMAAASLRSGGDDNDGASVCTGHDLDADFADLELRVEAAPRLA